MVVILTPIVLMVVGLPGYIYIWYFRSFLFVWFTSFAGFRTGKGTANCTIGVRCRHRATTECHVKKSQWWRGIERPAKSLWAWFSFGFGPGKHRVFPFFFGNWKYLAFGWFIFQEDFWTAWYFGQKKGPKLMAIRKTERNMPLFKLT